MIAAGRPKGVRRGKSGLHRAGCRITSGRGDSKESATEIYRPSFYKREETKGFFGFRFPGAGKGGRAV